MNRKIIFYQSHFIEFYQKQDQQVRRKIQYVFELIKQVERVPEKFLKHLTEQTDFMKSELNFSRTSTVFSAVLTKDKL